MKTAEYRLSITRYEIEGIPLYVYAPLGNDSSQETISEALPLVVVLHGLNSRKENQLAFSLRLVNAGYRVCTLDLRGHGERRNEDTDFLRLHWSEPQFAPAIGRTIIGSVLDIVSVVSELGVDRYYIAGHSLGGHIALLTALEDPRASAVCCIGGSLDLSALPTDPDRPSDVVARYDPVRRADALARKKVLLLHGVDDATVPITGAWRLWNAMETSGNLSLHSFFRTYPGIGHELAPVLMQDCIEWLLALNSDSTPNFETL
jgi:pimeloyl-ACP methyl ester carboxylesterase